MGLRYAQRHACGLSKTWGAWCCAGAAGHGLGDDAAVIQFFAKLTGIELPRKPS